MNSPPALISSCGRIGMCDRERENSYSSGRIMSRHSGSPEAQDPHLTHTVFIRGCLGHAAWWVANPQLMRAARPLDRH